MQAALGLAHPINAPLDTSDYPCQAHSKAPSTSPSLVEGLVGNIVSVLGGNGIVPSAQPVETVTEIIFHFLPA